MPATSATPRCGSDPDDPTTGTSSGPSDPRAWTIIGFGRQRWTGREQVAESRTPPMSAGGLDNFLRDVDGMEFNSATGQHCSQHQERDWDAVDAASARRLFFDAHPLRWLAVAGHGYPVGSPPIQARPSAGQWLTHPLWRDATSHQISHPRSCCTQASVFGRAHRVSVGGRV